MAQDQSAHRTRGMLRRLRRPLPAGLESTGEGGSGLTDSRIQTSLEAARERFRRIAERAGAGQEGLSQEQARVLADAKAALDRLAAHGDKAEITDSHGIGIEAVIVTDGTRPALFVQDDNVNPLVNDAGTWRARIAERRTAISEVARSVGRLNAEIGFPNFAGTAFVVAEGLVATNRHVLELLTGGPRPARDGTWHFVKPVTIDFAAEFERDRKSEFSVSGVAFAGPDPINETLSLPNLDLALLTVETSNGGNALPPPLKLSRRIKSLGQQCEVYVVGYPARPQDGSAEVLMRIFQEEYFVKRFAPGFVDDDPDTVDDGGHHRVFSHDASTLGGNSGSCVIEFRLEGRAVVGLHFGGFSLDKNYGHAIARIEEVLAQHGAKLED